VQLLLAGKSDVAVSRLAAQSLYRRLLKGGVQIHEYQPQILHAKLLIIDEAFTSAPPTSIPEVSTSIMN
jgi:cardiolipin synthase